MFYLLRLWVTYNQLGVNLALLAWCSFRPKWAKSLIVCMCVFGQRGPISSYPSRQYGVCSHLSEECFAAATRTSAAGHQDREQFQDLQPVRKHGKRQREQWRLQVWPKTNTQQTVHTHLCFSSLVSASFSVFYYSLDSWWRADSCLAHCVLLPPQLWSVSRPEGSSGPWWSHCLFRSNSVHAKIQRFGPFINCYRAVAAAILQWVPALPRPLQHCLQF